MKIKPPIFATWVEFFGYGVIALIVVASIAYGIWMEYLKIRFFLHNS